MSRRNPASAPEPVIQRFRIDEHGDALLRLMQAEGPEWKVYTNRERWPIYRDALESSLSLVVLVDGELAGFVRAIIDAGLYRYICDLLVAPAHRGRSLGAVLMRQVASVEPHLPLYVMSDADPYYEKLGFRREGSVFEVPAP